MKQRVWSMPFLLGVACVLFLTAPAVSAQTAPSVAEAESALTRAVAFFSKDVSIEGGYLWLYTADMKYRQGEGQAGPTTAWVQPPGTPSVGEALLHAYEQTGSELCLAAAKKTGEALVRGQLLSGGWDYRIEFEANERGHYAYRIEPADPKGRNTTTLDDDTTQSALRYLMRLDQVLEFKNAAVHDTVIYALDALMKAQYPNGAWPQRYSEFPDPAKYPVKRASYPDTWPPTFPDVKYYDYYTFNDNALADMIDTMFLATDIYGDARYAAAAEKAGDFILLAQMPDPQPAWAQQYDRDMHPAWARKFEPPSVTGGESHGAMQMLLTIYERTGKEKYLEPLPRALKYLKASQLPDGRLARFYELKTNRPLYFTLDYQLTYSPDNMPTHYAFIVGSKLDRIEEEYNRLKATPPKPQDPEKRRPPKMTDALAKAAAQAIATQNERGAWLERGEMKKIPEAGTTDLIDCRVFASRLRALADYIAAARAGK